MTLDKSLFRILFTGMLALQTYVVHAACILPTSTAESVSNSMMPTYHAGDLFTLQCLTHSDGYLSPRVTRGDIIKFYVGRFQTYYLKRVVGLPGDYVQIQKGVVYINTIASQQTKKGEVDPKDYGESGPVMDRVRESLPDGAAFDILTSKDTGGYANNTPVFHVPANHYFVLGDNRPNSLDSRFFSDGVGFVSEDDIESKVVGSYR